MGSFSCCGTMVGDLHTESTIIANTAVAGGLAYVYLQGMISLSAENFADTISFIQQVASIASIIAFAHSAVKWGSDIVIDTIYEEGIF